MRVRRARGMKDPPQPRALEVAGGEGVKAGLWGPIGALGLARQVEGVTCFIA